MSGWNGWRRYELMTWRERREHERRCSMVAAVAVITAMLALALIMGWIDARTPYPAGQEPPAYRSATESWEGRGRGPQ